MHTYMYVTRVISISDDAYDSLSKIKRGRSFSETILSLTGNENKRDLYDIVMSRGPDHELADAIEEVYKKRSRFKFRKVEL